MEAQTLEARFEQITINDQNEDPFGPRYHKSKVSVLEQYIASC
jgi:hypothetical protein